MHRTQYLFEAIFLGLEPLTPGHDALFGDDRSWRKEDKTAAVGSLFDLQRHTPNRPKLLSRDTKHPHKNQHISRAIRTPCPVQKSTACFKNGTNTASNAAGCS
jgi:hypothetical protein